MMNTWSREIWRLLGYAAGGWLLGLVYGLPCGDCVPDCWAILCGTC